MSKSITPQGNGQSEPSIEDRLGAFVDDEQPSEAADREVPESDEETPEEPEGDDETTEEPEGDEGSEDAEEADGDEEANELPEPSDDAFVEIKGKKVSIKELKSGYFREADYTRKTQAVAEQRKQVEAFTVQLAQERQAALQALQDARNYMQQAMPQEPNWQELYVQDPQQYAIQREAWRSMREQQQAMQAHQNALFQQKYQHDQAEQQELLQAEMGKLLEALPEWNKPEVRQQEQAKLTEYGQQQGYTVDELGSVTDHRAMVVLRKAMLYDELMARRATLKPQTRGPKTIVPGAAQAAVGRSAKRGMEARKRLATSGSVRDAADLMAGFLED